MAYSAKYASAFGPFREAVGSGGRLKGDKRTYQMDPANSDEALQEIALDIEEVPTWLWSSAVLPDIASRCKQLLCADFAYQVSGEYAMLAGAVAQGWLERDTVIWKRSPPSNAPVPTVFELFRA